MRLIEVKQIRSPIRRPGYRRATLIGLGLNKIGRVRWVPETCRGTIAKVAHLVKMTHDPSAPKLSHVAQVYDEAADAALMRELAFDPMHVVLELYSKAELLRGRLTSSRPERTTPSAANGRAVAP
jgi:large subunit ribosomal protein L30